MDVAALHARLRERFGAAIGACHADARDPWIEVAPGAVAEVCRFLRDEPELHFDCLSNQTGIDWRARGVIQVVYHLLSYAHRHQAVLKAEVPREAPELPSVTGVWPAANWMDREIYDLLGVTFTGHPDLRRLLMPEDWVGHPLRKDFVEPESYHGISTRRESLLR